MIVFHNGVEVFLEAFFFAKTAADGNPSLSIYTYIHHIQNIRG